MIPEKEAIIEYFKDDHFYGENVVNNASRDKNKQMNVFERIAIESNGILWIDLDEVELLKGLCVFSRQTETRGLMYESNKRLG